MRKFRPDVALRHIPRCKDIKARPNPPKYRQKPPLSNQTEFKVKGVSPMNKMSYTMNGEIFK